MALRAIITLDDPIDVHAMQAMSQYSGGIKITENTVSPDHYVYVEPDWEVKFVDQRTPVSTPNEALVKLSAMLAEAINSDDEIDRHYILEAVNKDIDAMSQGDHSLSNLIDLLDNPVS